MISAERSSSRVLYQVCWKSVVGGAVGRERPVPRNVAEFVARDEALANPLRRYWVERFARLGDDADAAATADHDAADAADAADATGAEGRGRPRS